MSTIHEQPHIDVMTAHLPTSTCVDRGWVEASLLRERERAKRETHVSNGADCGSSGDDYFREIWSFCWGLLQSTPDVACSTGAVDCVWRMTISKQNLRALNFRGAVFSFVTSIKILLQGL